MLLPYWNASSHTALKCTFTMQTFHFHKLLTNCHTESHNADCIFTNTEQQLYVCICYLYIKHPAKQGAFTIPEIHPKFVSRYSTYNTVVTRRSVFLCSDIHTLLMLPDTQLLSLHSGVHTLFPLLYMYMIIFSDINLSHLLSKHFHLS